MANNVIFDEPYTLGMADYGKFVKVDRSYVESLGYPASGHGKYALMTYMVNPISLSASDISIGSVEIKDADTDTNVNVIPLASSNAMTVAIVDGSGDQFTSLGTVLYAVSGVPTPVADGDPVNQWFDTYGRAVDYGSNLSVGAQDVNIVNQAELSRMGPIQTLVSVVSTGNSVATDVSNYHNFTVQINSSSVTSGAVIEVQQSLDGTNFATVASKSISANGVTEVTISQQAYLYLRTSIISRVDGTYSTYLYAGN